MITGRSSELARCDEVLGRALDGGSGRLVVVGDPGIGKTALLDAARRRAVRRGLRVVHASGVEGEDDLPFALLDDVLRAAAAEPSPDAARVSRRGDNLLRHLVSLTASGPLLLVVDDVQFADPASLAALVLAVERGDDLPLATVVAARPGDVADQRFAAWPRLELGPLPLDAAVALLRAELGPAREPALRLPDVAAALGGNPLGLREVAHLLTAAQLAGRAPLPDPLPVGPALQHAWGDRLKALGDDARLALLDLAIAGGEPSVLTALAADAGYGDAALDEAAGSRLLHLTPGERPAFHHPLVREVVLARLPGPQVRARHRLAAAAAERLGLPPSVVVHHLVRAVVEPDADVAAAIAAQADRAEQLERYDDALPAWEAAARLSPDRADRAARALRGVHAVATYAVSLQVAPSLAEMAEEAPLGPRDRCLVEWVRASVLMEADPPAGLAQLWTAVGQATTAAPDLVPALLWDAAAQAWTLGDVAAGLRAARLLADGDPAGRSGRDDPGARWTMGDEMPAWGPVGLLAVGLFQAGDVAASVPLRAEAIRAAAGVDPERADLVDLLAVVFLDDVLLDDSPEAQERIRVAVRRVGAGSEPQACMWGMQAWQAKARGDWAGALRLVAQGRPIAVATSSLTPLAGMGALEVELAALRGDDATVEARLEPLLALLGRLHDRRRQATVDRALGLRALVDGRMEAALTSLRAAADVPFLGRGLRDAVLPARVDVVEVLARIGDPAEARRRCGEVLPLLAAMGEPLADALAARAQALVSDDAAAADARFAEATWAHERAGEPFEHARTLLLHGEALRRWRRRGQARRVLSEAAARFAALGAQPWRARAEQELRAAGGTAAAGGAASGAAVAGGAAAGTAVAGGQLLTPQEQAVAGAVAEGRSNREVAELLVLSPRTVEYHLGNVYRKLGVHGRAALAARLTRDRLAG